MSESNHCHFKNHAYFNLDNRADRKSIIASSWPGNVELLIFDELHKYRQWKSFIKGEFDKLKNTYKFLVTGSARLDIYRRGGDSLQGRYHYYRLHPFTLAEVEGINSRIEQIRMKLGGYFQSVNILETNLLLQINRLKQGIWKKPIPMLKAKAHDIL